MFGRHNVIPHKCVLGSEHDATYAPHHCFVALVLMGVVISVCVAREPGMVLPRERRAENTHKKPRRIDTLKCIL
jgi:hypothetical protein